MPTTVLGRRCSVPNHCRRDTTDISALAVAPGPTVSTGGSKVATNARAASDATRLRATGVLP